MAQINEKRQLEGLIGNVYVRTLNGKRIVQSRPAKRKSSKGSTASGKSFSNAVAQSNTLRMALHTLLLQGTDPYASQRLTGVFQKAFHQPTGTPEQLTLFTADLSGLNGFEFHKQTPLSQYIATDFPFQIMGDGTLQLEATAIPAIDAKLFPDTNTSCGLAIMVTTWQPGATALTAPEVFGFELQKQGPAQIELQTAAYPAGTRFIVAAQLLAWKSVTALGDRNYYNSKQFNPVGIVFTGRV